MQGLIDTKHYKDENAEVYNVKEATPLTRLLQDSQNFVASNALHLGDAIGVAKDNTDLYIQE